MEAIGVSADAVWTARQARADSVVVEMGDRQIAPDALLSEGFEHLVLHCMRSRANQSQG